MDVKEFVSSTILQVMQAVAETQAVARELGGYVNPTAQHLGKESNHLGTTALDQAIYSIDFDIAVTVGSESGAEGGGKLHVASVISIGGKAKSADKFESVSRVRFAVPLTLPVDVASDQERKDRNARVSARMREAATSRPSREW